MRLQSDGAGTWTYNGRSDDSFNSCYDIDLPLTPFTNTLPINRLPLKLHESVMIKVIYIDLLEDAVRTVFQRYVRISHSEYRYENVPNDFEAVIKVDKSGFVQDYPGLFRRIASVDL